MLSYDGDASSPQALFGGTAPTAGGVAVINSFQCNSQLDPITSCFMPDFTVKMAVDPGWGHYELFGLARGFRDRQTTPFISAHNNETVGFSGGGGAILPIWGDKLQLQGNVLYGQGVGRYDAAQLFDATFSPNGSVDPLTGFSIMGGITSHNAIKDLDLYAYAGENHVFNHFGDSTGFGNPALINNSGCDILGSLLCSGTSVSTSTPGIATLSQGQLQDVWQVTGGFWQSLYDGDKGKVVWGLQDSFTVASTVADNNGIRGTTDMNVVMSSFRYYPKYGNSGRNPAVTIPV